MHKTRRKSFNNACEKSKGERKLKLLFETDKEMKNQSFLPSIEKIRMQKETRITPRKERLKTTWITHAFQVKTNRNLLMKMKCVFPIPMNDIYKKEQEVSSKENNVNSNARNTNSL